MCLVLLSEAVLLGPVEEKLKEGYSYYIQHIPVLNPGVAIIFITRV